MLKWLASVVILLTFSFGLNAQDVRIYETFDEFEPLLKNQNDTTYVINFWATWCKPCIEEMPGFLKLDDKFRNEKFKLILTSLDFDSQIESKLKPYIRDNNIKADVVLLADSKAHTWIDRVNEDWSGSIPITIVYNKDFYFFREGMLSFEELNELITNNLKK